LDKIKVNKKTSFAQILFRFHFNRNYVKLHITQINMSDTWIFPINFYKYEKLKQCLEVFLY